MRDYGEHLGRLYRLSDRLTRLAQFEPYNVINNQPDSWRRLRVFALDPSVSRLEGAVATVRVPCEDLERGPISQLFRVDMNAPAEGTCYQEADLNAPDALRSDGVAADPADPIFHAQMVYALALSTYEAFRRALGRHIVWGFDGEGGAESAVLTLRPFGMRQKNAYYSRDAKAVCFGYFNPASKFRDPIHVFTSLSSDIITHEVSHAILDGLRPYFSEPTNPDVLAFHEAFADLIAVFQRFTFTEMLCVQLQKARGYLGNHTLLRMLAPEVGKALGLKHGLRTFKVALREAAEDEGGERELSVVALQDLSADAANSPHQRGRVLAEAVFDAFATIVRRKTDPLIGLATGGSGRLPEGNLPVDLVNQLVHVTRRTADQFRTICIRAIDYCPPVDLDFGDYLRALITADRELVKDDIHGYREAIINAFRRRGIFPRQVATMSEVALAWNGPERRMTPIVGLSLSDLRFRGYPAVPLDAAELRRRACIFGEAVTGSAGLMNELGLVPPGDGFDVPEIVSIRPAQRVGPDGQVGFDQVAEIVQTRYLQIAGRKVAMRGGATVIIDSLGAIRFIIRKRVDHEERAKELEAFVSGAAGASYWSDALARDVFRSLCFDSGTSNERPVKAQLPDAATQTFVLVHHPVAGARGEIKVNGGLFSIDTGRPAPVPIGRNRFDLDVHGAPFIADLFCPAGHTDDKPFLVDLAPP